MGDNIYILHTSATPTHPFIHAQEEGRKRRTQKKKKKLTNNEAAEYTINQAKSAVLPRKLLSSRFREYRLMKKIWNMKSRLSGPKYRKVVPRRQYCRFCQTLAGL